MKKSSVLLLCIPIAIFFTSCSKQSPVEPVPSYKRGELISSTPLQSYSAEEIRQILSFLQVSDSFAIQYNVNTVKIVYQTADHEGNLVKASGALFFPENATNMPMISLQHGTVMHRDNVASTIPSSTVEGLCGLVMSGQGYITCLPDYTGFGISETIHPYHHARSLAIAVIDFIRTCRIYCIAHDIFYNDQLFLTGYSEGGYATLAAQKQIEQEYGTEFILTAVAPMAGPYDMMLTARLIFEQVSYIHPSHIAFLLTAYDQIYQWNLLERIFRSPYATQMTDLFDGSYYSYEIDNQLPSNLTSLLNQEFIASVQNESNQVVINAFKENSILSWRPYTPIRFYHGDNDLTSPYQNAIAAVDSFTSRGATDIELITIEGGNHETSGLPAVIDMMKWINSFQ